MRGIKAVSGQTIKSASKPCFSRSTTPNAGVAWEDGSYNFPNEWYWQQGRVSNNLNRQKSYPYFHFFEWKLLWKGKEFDLHCSLEKNNSWTMSENGIGLYD